VSFPSLLTQTLTFQRPTVTLDSSGAPSPKVYNNLVGATSVPGLIQPLSARERLLYAQRQVTVSHRCWVGSNYGLRRDDRCLKDVDPSRYYLVVTLLDRAGQQRVFEVILKEVAAA
jgi:hypothetical protein